MIIRIVRMHFKESEVETFLNIFNENKQSIRHFKGCTHLELLKDLKDPNLYTTLSYWINEESLEAYRNSELFKHVWSNVKILFAEKSKAYSLEKFIEL
ncbi:MAG TPA: antibiotic biosynthesis monooxygenase family protein [Cyclobacteriaceae bacterium]|nr:antibiotic biosynthesis monooxygenase family protein [Cyclobacteriaceae bacterium]